MGLTVTAANLFSGPRAGLPGRRIDGVSLREQKDRFGSKWSQCLGRAKAAEEGYIGALLQGRVQGKLTRGP